MTDVELFRFNGSNACVTVERLLDVSDIPWRAHEMRPMLHVVTLRRHGFPGRTAPAARINGVRVQGSRDISHAIADAHPELGLLPADPAARDVVLAAEAQGEQLQNALRRIFYVLAQRDIAVVQPLVDDSFSRVPRVGRRLIARVLVPLAAKGHAARPERINGYLDRVGGLLTEFDALVERGVLGSDTPNVADFQIGPNLAALATAPTARELLESRPSWRIAERTCPTYPLGLTTDIPQEWIARLRGDAASA